MFAGGHDTTPAVTTRSTRKHPNSTDDQHGAVPTAKQRYPALCDGNRIVLVPDVALRRHHPK
jgi:hypothetical protein